MVAVVAMLPCMRSSMAVRTLASATGGYQAEMLQFGFQAVADSRDSPFMRMARR
jgi:hypothetical protein